MEAAEKSATEQIDRIQRELLAVHYALGSRAVYGLGSKLIELDRAVMATGELTIDLIGSQSTLDHRIAS